MSDTEKMDAAKSTEAPATGAAVLAANTDYVARSRVAKQKNLTIPMMEILAADSIPAVRLSLVRNMKAVFSDEMMMVLAADEHPVVRAAVAKRSDVTPGVCKVLKRDSDNRVREALCGNRHTSPEALVTLSYEKFHKSQAEVGANPNTPVNTLTRLVKSKHPLVQCSVLKNSNLPVEVLREFSTHADWRIRKAIASNRCVPLDVLVNIMGTIPMNSELAHSVVVHPDATVEMLEAMGEIKKLPPRTKNALLHRLAKSPEYEGMPKEWIEQVVFE